MVVRPLVCALCLLAAQLASEASAYKVGDIKHFLVLFYENRAFDRESKKKARDTLCFFFLFWFLYGLIINLSVFYLC